MFSMMIGCPRLSFMCSASTRISASTAPPAGSVTTTVTGFDGKDCADAGEAAASVNAIAAISRFIVSLSLDVGGLDDRPPLVGLGLLERAQRLRRLLGARRRLQPERCEALPGFLMRQRFEHRGVEP